MPPCPFISTPSFNCQSPQSCSFSISDFDTCCWFSLKCSPLLALLQGKLTDNFESLAQVLPLGFTSDSPSKLDPPPLCSRELHVCCQKKQWTLYNPPCSCAVSKLLVGTMPITSVNPAPNPWQFLAHGICSINDGSAGRDGCLDGWMNG